MRFTRSQNLGWAFGLTIVFALYAPITAYADWAGALMWCQNEPGAPTRFDCQIAVMPDGNRRGFRSAATLIAEAKTAARNGNCGAAISWAVHCQCHNQDEQNAISGNSEAVCNWLRAH